MTPRQMMKLLEQNGFGFVRQNGLCELCCNPHTNPSATGSYRSLDESVYPSEKRETFGGQKTARRHQAEKSSKTRVLAVSE